MKKRLVSAFLALSLVSAMFPPGALAAESADGGSTVTGSGVQTVAPALEQVGGVYQLKSEADLRTFAQLVSSADGAANANAVLVNDITLAGAWSPIGSVAKPYTGTFNGASHTISGLKGYLFDHLGAGGRIENVLLSGLDGYICQVSQGVIVNCTNNIPSNTGSASGTVTGGASDNTGSTGGTVTGGASSNTGSTSGTVSGGAADNTGSNSGTVTGGAADNTGSTSGTVTGGAADNTGSTSGTVTGGTTNNPTTGGEVSNTNTTTAKTVTLSPAKASCKLGETVTVNVSGAIPLSTLAINGVTTKRSDVGADGKTYFSIDTGASPDFAPKSGNTETFTFTLDTNGVQVGTFELTVTDPDAVVVKPELKSAVQTNQNSTTSTFSTKSSTEQSINRVSASQTDQNDIPAAKAAQYDLSQARMEYDAPFYYDGTNEPKIRIYIGTDRITQDGNFTVTYADNDKVSKKATVTVRALSGGSCENEKTFEYEISARPVKIANVVAEGRPYLGGNKQVKILSIDLQDAETGASISDSNVFVNITGLQGILTSDASGLHDQLDGFSRTLTLDGTAKENYTLVQPSSYPLSIPQIQIGSIVVDCKSADITPKIYDGGLDANVETIPFINAADPTTAEKLELNHDYRIIKAEFDNPTVGKDKDVTIVVELISDNCKFENPDADNPNRKTFTVNTGIINQAQLTFDGMASAVVKYYDNSTKIKLDLDDVSLSSNNINFKDDIESVEAVFQDPSPGTGKPYTVTITLAPDKKDNYNITDTVGGTISKEFTDGEIKALTNYTVTWPSFDGHSVKDDGITITYGTKLQDVSLTGGSASDASSTVAGSFTWEEVTEPLAVGTSVKPKLIFTPNDSNYAPQDIPVTVTVNPAALTITPAFPDEFELIYGQSLSEITKNIKVTGVAGEETIAGRWEWSQNSSPVQETTIPETSGTQYTALFRPTSSNYQPSAAQDITVYYKAGVPEITLTRPTLKPTGENLCTPGERIDVEVLLKNAYNSQNSQVHKPQIAGTITYQIGDKTPAGLTGTDTGGYFRVDEDAENDTEVKIIVKTAGDGIHYEATEKVFTLKVTAKTKLVPKADPVDSIYDGTPKDGYTNAETEYKGKKLGVEYDPIWTVRGSSTPLEGAPTDAGEYTVYLVIDDKTYAGTSEPINFTIKKRQLQWPHYGWLSAHKTVGTGGEADVTGTIEMLNEAPGDTVDFNTPAMQTSGFAKYTEQGKYYDVYAVPKKGTWSDYFIPATLKNYEWPTGNPIVTASIGDQAASTEPLKVPPEAIAGNGETLMVDFANGVSEESYQALKGAGSAFNSQTAISKVLTDAVMAKNTSIDAKNTVVYDITLMVVGSDGVPKKASKSNFPTNGRLTVTLPYPKNSDKNTPYFTIAHMYTTSDFGQKPGYIEYPTIKSKTDTTISFEVTGLSPIAIGWSNTQTTGSDNNNNNNNNNNNSSDKDKPSSSEEETYRVRVLRTSHGRVTVSHARAEADETVTITIRPNSGYSLDELTVTDSRDREIRVRSRSNNRYTFKMPARAVTIDATFTDGSSSSSSATLTPATLPVWTAGNYGYLNCDGVTNCPSRRFSDLNTAMWYHIPVDYCIQNNLMGAMGNGGFGPSQTLTRAMLVQILYNHANRPYASASTSFRDVDRGAWYESAVSWAVSNGIASGMGNGTFAPNTPITREQLAVMLYNYATRRGLGRVSAGGSASFTDRASISSWALNAVSAMQSSGIIAGKAGGGFDPKGRATRCETAQMLWNLLK